MSLIQLLRILYARRLILLGCLVASLAVAGAVGLILPARYQATARIIMDVFKKDPVTGDAMSRANVSFFLRTQVELIKDFRVIGEAVDELGMTNNPQLLATWQAETGGAGDFRRWISDRISRGVTVNMVAGSNIMAINYEAPNPEIARRTVNALRTAYIENSLRMRTDSAGRNAEWYREQAERSLKALQIAEDAKNRFERDNGIVMTGDTDAESAKLASLQAALTASRSSQTVQQFEAMRQATNSAVVEQLKVQLASLNDSIEQASERLGTQHPTYIAMLARRAQMERQLAREQAVSRQAGAQQLGASRSGIAALEAEYEAQRAKVFGMKDKLDQHSRLRSEVELRRQEYEMATRRTSQLQMESNISDTGMVVLGDATVSPQPSFPNWPSIFGLGAGVGLALGLTMAMLIELLNRRVRGAEDLSLAARVPVFAVIADRRRPQWQQTLKRLITRGKSNATGWAPAQ
ncbi:GumC family protein [Sandarakinorhabdus rubra]|uniref:GumC family protein n=1 Tax=Sandarakinorhabdus rubra TaxID=2672568 RepID=UPI0022A6BA75|nr:Wzz/FepE/Etk N-terminal domain-containing protein [Sandarakinorhabdus rubra]